MRQRILIAVTFSVLSVIAMSDRGYAEFRGFGSHGQFEDTQRRLQKPPSVDLGLDGDAAPLAGTVIGPDTRLLAEAVMGVGYDSNIDHLINSNKDGGAYALTDFGVGLIHGPSDAQTTIVARGGYGAHDIDNRPDRWDAGGLIDHYRIVAPHTSFNVGGFFLHDDIDVDANERAAGYYELAYRGSDAEWFYRGRALYTHYLIAAGAPPAINRFFSRDETFDHRRLEQSVGAMLFKDQRLAPFFEVGYANLDYTHQIDPLVFSRDADEIWLSGGVRVTLAPRLHFDLGARYNQRWLDDPTISSHDTIFFDGKVVWQAHDSLYFEVNVDRSFVEPIVADALFTESTTYSLLMLAQIDRLTSFKGEIGHIVEDQIGAPDKFEHLFGEVTLTHAIGPGTDIFAHGLAYHSVNEFNDLEADRASVLLGIKVHN